MHGLLIGFNIPEVAATIWIPYDLNNYETINHRSNYIIDRLANLVDFDTLSSLQDFNPVAIEMQCAQDSSNLFRF